MARTGLGNVGMFLPPEISHRWPGAYENILRGEALKSAKYLSAMDQFYAGLDQAQEQFEATLAAGKEQWEARLEHEKWLKWRDVNLGRRQISAQSRSAQASLDWDKSKYAQEQAGKREVFEFYKGLMGEQQTQRQAMFGGIFGGKGRESVGGDSDFWGGQDWKDTFGDSFSSYTPDGGYGKGYDWEGWEHGEYGSGGSKSDWGDFY